MFEKCDWTKYLIDILKHNYWNNNVYAVRGNICFDFFFSLRNHSIYILIVTRLFKPFLKSYMPDFYLKNVVSGYVEILSVF